MKRIVQLLILALSCVPLFLNAQVKIEFITANCIPGKVTVRATAPFGLKDKDVYWTINHTRYTNCVSDPYRCSPWGNPIIYDFLSSGVYVLGCNYQGVDYYSDPIYVNVKVADKPICGNYWGPPSGIPGINSTWINSQNDITNCTTGPTIVKGTSLDHHYTPGELFLRSEKSITLQPGFEAEAGSLFLAEIGLECAPNSSAREAEEWISAIDYRTDVDLHSSVLPNPNDGSFMLNINNPSKGLIEIKVINFTGKEVFSEKYGNDAYLQKPVDLTMLDPGVYIVEIWKGNNLEVQKIVIAK
jgi:hypothetical protein